jgi:hypothetical protein
MLVPPQGAGLPTNILIIVIVIPVVVFIILVAAIIAAILATRKHRHRHVAEVFQLQTQEQVTIDQVKK